MNSIPPSPQETLQIPEALTLEHDQLRAELKRAALMPGSIGRTARRVARLCCEHFAEEEECVFLAFGMLHDLASDRLRPDAADVVPIIAKFNARHHVLRHYYPPVDVALEKLLKQALKQKNTEIAELVHKIRDHEKTEDETIYPTVLLIANAVREGVRI